MSSNFKIRLCIVFTLLISACDQRPPVTENSPDGAPPPAPDTYGEQLGEKSAGNTQCCNGTLTAAAERLDNAAVTPLHKQ